MGRTASPSNSPPRGNLRKRNAPLSKQSSDTSDVDTETEPEPEPEPELDKKTGLPPRAPTTMSKIATRSAAGICMIAFYCAMLRAGHFYCILVAVLTQFELFRELVNVRYVEAKERAMPLFRTLQWSWFLLAMLFVCKYIY
jgi:hypothetical protein